MQEDNNQIPQPPTLQEQQQQQQQQQSSNTPTTISSRHYVDKARLIKLVHENPILWDCRLPNYKRADKSKTDQWNSLGAIFSVSGERVQRTFTSLREIFRRELNNEKLLGRRFKSKWEFYKSMSFLRDVIRERKPRERHPTKLTRRNQLSPSINNPPSNSNGIDEYQYFAPNDPNNPSLQNQQQQTQQQQQQQQQQLQSIIPPTNEKLITTLKPELTQIPIGNTSQLSVLSLLTQLNNGTQQQTQKQQQKQPQQQQQQQSHMQADDDDEVNIIQPSPATSTTPSMYIKDEIEIPDEDDDDDVEEEEDTTSITFNGEILYSNNNKLNIVNSNVLNDMEGANQCKRRPTKFNRNAKNWKRVSKTNSKEDCEVLEDDDDEDIDEDELSSVESIPNANNIINNGNKSKILLGNGMVNNLNDESKVNHHDLMHEQLSSVSCIGGGIGQLGASVSLNGGEAEVKYRRHLVYTKFADFIVAKMDAMCERDADDLMDRMMLVIAQKH